ncbi:hypothetical protein M501DRAFT_985875 [Patellaria atrata CBS 101060]|uniref:Uncharacterized protein n=1 Tax=Patellaria atrata CBS 101060 TaxID=1346257 RepID=A0A9P4SLF4_9PEZI|nr:hypothetical protein M501DRAFT_985875 [Patellaria atrata CBS 101060]
MSNILKSLFNLVGKVTFDDIRKNNENGEEWVNAVSEASKEQTEKLQLKLISVDLVEKDNKKVKSIQYKKTEQRKREQSEKLRNELNQVIRIMKLAVKEIPFHFLISPAPPQISNWQDPLKWGFGGV